MDNADYVVFEPVLAAPRPRARPTFRADSIFKLDIPGIDPSPDPAPPEPTGAETLRSVSGHEAAAAERDAGRAVFRIPMMPLRLIPQPGGTPDDPAAAPWGIAAMGADRTGDLQGEGVCVAILDTGIDAGHPAFAGLIRDDNYVDFTGTGKQDNVGHGTHCAGIIFGRPVCGTRIGIAPGIDRVLIGKIADTNFQATTSLLQKALTWAVGAGADIISLSIGLDFLGHAKRLEQGNLPPGVALARALNDYRDYTRFFDRLMATVVSAGAASNAALVIAACGNDSDMVGQGVRVPATLPAVAENVIAVGALARTPGGALSIAPFSNTGANICGPGAAILSAKPGGGLASMTGTSQAAPHVAGAAALWWQKLRRERGERPTPAEVRLELLAAAKRDGIDGAADFEAAGRGLAMAPPADA